MEVYKCLFPWPLCHKVSEKGVPMCFLLLITLSGEGAVCCTDSSVRPPGGPWHEAGSTESCVTPLQLLLLLYWTCVLLAEQYTDAKSTSIYNDLPTPPIPQCYLTSLPINRKCLCSLQIPNQIQRIYRNISWPSHQTYAQASVKIALVNNSQYTVFMMHAL